MCALSLISKGTDIPAELRRYWMTLAKTDIIPACEPLKQYGISYVLYVKRFSDGSQIELTNRPDWSEFYYQKEYYLIGPYKKVKHFYDDGKFLWCARGDIYQEMYQDYKESFNIAHGVTHVIKRPDCNEFFHFAGEPQNVGLINFYLNNPEVIERFMLYFKDKLSHVIEEAENHRLLIVPNSLHTTSQQKQPMTLHSFKKKMPVERYYLCEETKMYLTKREVECTRWHILGKTAEETSIILSISKRTVEAHLDKAKQKLNCLKHTQLAYKLGLAVNAL